jgi:hypothetical protein
MDLWMKWKEKNDKAIVDLGMPPVMAATYSEGAVSGM